MPTRLTQLIYSAVFLLSLVGCGGVYKPPLTVEQEQAITQGVSDADAGLQLALTNAQARLTADQAAQATPPATPEKDAAVVADTNQVNFYTKSLNSLRKNVESMATQPTMPTPSQIYHKAASWIPSPWKEMGEAAAGGLTLLFAYLQTRKAKATAKATADASASKDEAFAGAVGQGLITVKDGATAIVDKLVAAHPSTNAFVNQVAAAGGGAATTPDVK